MARTYDVIVCGAGVAGVAAAVAAARQGAKVALLEKQCLIGGLATAGLIYIFLPLCNGNGEQVIHGLPEEMLRRGAKYGPFAPAEQWGGPSGGNPGIPSKRFLCCFSPAGMVLSLDEMLREAGVDLWLDSLVTAAETRDGFVREVTLFNTSGSISLQGKCFVDATGGAHVIRLAGGRTFPGENFVTPWLLEVSERSQPFSLAEGLYVRSTWGDASGVSLDETERAASFPRCDDGRAVTAFVRDSWRLARELYDGLPNDDARRRNFPVTLPSMPQLRKIARIDAELSLDEGAYGKCYSDSIGRVGDWRRDDAVWDTPYRALVPRGLKNILAAGRCIGAAGDAWEVFRVIPAAAMTGEAAGIAAALAARQNGNAAALPPPLLQAALATARKPS